FLSAANQLLWERLCHALDCRELLGDPRFADNPSRVEHRAQVTKALEAVLARHSVRKLVRVLQQARVPCAPVNSLDAVVEDEQVRTTGMLQVAEHSRIPDFTVVASAVATNGRFPTYRNQPPELGGDTRAILGELGYDDRCDELCRRGVASEPSRAASTNGDHGRQRGGDGPYAGRGSLRGA
ncbi:MAG: CoA transferase, partial [Solirubrobacteraceae bacterium]